MQFKRWQLKLLKTSLLTLTRKVHLTCPLYGGTKVWVNDFRRHTMNRLGVIKSCSKQTYIQNPPTCAGVNKFVEQVNLDQRREGKRRSCNFCRCPWQVPGIRGDSVEQLNFSISPPFLTQVDFCQLGLLPEMLFSA